MGKTSRFFRKVVIAFAGTILIIIGVLLLVLPGPGIAVIALGLFVLSLEFSWAEKHYKRLETEALKLLDRVRKRF